MAMSVFEASLVLNFEECFSFVKNSCACTLTKRSKQPSSEQQQHHVSRIQAQSTPVSKAGGIPQFPHTIAQLHIVKPALVHGHAFSRFSHSRVGHPHAHGGVHP